MRLYFLRHGDAELKPASSDADRKLTDEGISQAECTSRAISSMKLSLTAIFSSPLIRAQQTAEIVSRTFPSLSVQPLDQLAPSSQPHDLFRELLSVPRDGRILLVSHEPFISHCIASLVGGVGEPKISIKKGSLAGVEVGSPVQAGAGVLLWLLTNEQMKLMAM